MGEVAKRQTKGTQPKNAIEKSIECNEIIAQKVFVEPGQVTILSFPLPPKEVLPGHLAFDFKQIRNDLAIKAISPGGRTNVVIYLEHRRCLFDVQTSLKASHGILIVRDPKENLIEWEFK